MSKQGGGDPFRKVLAGDKLRIPAEAYNGFIDAALAHKNGGLSPRALTSEFGKEGLIKIVNETGVDLDKYGIATIYGPLFSTANGGIERFKKQPVFRAAAVGSASDYTGTWPIIVAQEPIKDGKVGFAKISGITPVEVDVYTAYDRYASFQVGSDRHSQLRSMPFGSARILTMDGSLTSDTRETKWCYVELGVEFSGIVLGRTGSGGLPLMDDDGSNDMLMETPTPDSVGVFRVHKEGGVFKLWGAAPYGSGGYADDSSEAISLTVHNPFVAVDGIQNVACQLIGGSWFVIASGC